MEEIFNVKPVQIDFKCPKCPSGYLRPSGLILYSNPLKYPHICNNPNCNHRDTFEHTYPYIDYKYIY